MSAESSPPEATDNFHEKVPTHLKHRNEQVNLLYIQAKE